MVDPAMNQAMAETGAVGRAEPAPRLLELAAANAKRIGAR
jgi:hypothetical protein